jgi:predicted DsbA family dithiol-disulfide isomerase
MPPADPIKVDVWSDIACPWCYIGKRRLEAGVSAFRESAGSPPVVVEYHSFELAPDTPVDFDGSEIDFLVRHKHVPEEQVRRMLDHVAALARSVGLDYRFDRLRHTNTVKAHQLLHYAKAHGRQPRCPLLRDRRQVRGVGRPARRDVHPGAHRRRRPRGRQVTANRNGPAHRV